MSSADILPRVIKVSLTLITSVMSRYGCNFVQKYKLSQTSSESAPVLLPVIYSLHFTSLLSLELEGRLGTTDDVCMRLLGTKLLTT